MLNRFEEYVQHMLKGYKAKRLKMRKVKKLVSFKGTHSYCRAEYGGLECDFK
jgi:hypothetical protein